MALLLTAELLSFSPQTPRATLVLDALARAAAGITVQRTSTYRGGSDLLVLWGPGHPARFGPMRDQIAAGGHVAALDLAYWQRDLKFRVSIDAAHPQAWVMRQVFADGRFAADNVPTGHVWDPNGPVIVAGLGQKSRVQYGAETIDQWEADMIASVRAAGKQVIYRRKSTTATPIEQALVGASALITWHSNTAVDAIRLGVPVVCRDGAAAAVCGSVYALDLQPLPIAMRDQFLANLAWFQWAPSEAAQTWSWLRGMLA